MFDLATLSEPTREEAMTTTTKPSPEVPLPPGAVLGDIWEGDDPQRVIMGPDRGITDSDAIIWTTAMQSADGRITSEPYPPHVHIQHNTDGGFNSDQARQLAAALLEAAAEMDVWTR
jgi:hypothetical protein